MSFPLSSKELCKQQSVGYICYTSTHKKYLGKADAVGKIQKDLQTKKV